MRVTNDLISRKVRQLTNAYPLPEGYMYTVDVHNPGDGKFYQLCIVRRDYQHGDFYNMPGIGGYKGPGFVALINGMLEAVWMPQAIARLPKVSCSCGNKATVFEGLTSRCKHCANSVRRNSKEQAKHSLNVLGGTRQ